MLGRNNKKITMLFGLLLSVTFAAITSVALATIGHSYLTREDDLIQGMAVSLSLENTDQNQFVEALSQSNKERFVGVVSSKESNTVTTVRSGDNVFVSTNGQSEVLASDLNGEIKQGDNLVASPLKGVVMKAGTGESTSVGYALEDFDYSKTTTETITDEQGNTKEVKIAAIAMEISTTGSTGDTQKSFLSLVGESITGKEVSQLQVVAAVLLLFVVLTVEGSIIYGAAHSTITSVGRNPLARKSIYKQLVQIIVVAGIILLFGIGGIYLILWV